MNVQVLLLKKRSLLIPPSQFKQMKGNKQNPESISSFLDNVPLYIARSL
jgi:hypothetical protein